MPTVEIKGRVKRKFHQNFHFTFWKYHLKKRDGGWIWNYICLKIQLTFALQGCTELKWYEVWGSPKDIIILSSSQLMQNTTVSLTHYHSLFIFFAFCKFFGRIKMAYQCTAWQNFFEYTFWVWPIGKGIYLNGYDGHKWGLSKYLD